MPFYDRFKTFFASFILSVFTAAQDHARAQRLDPGARPYSIGLSLPGFFPDVLQNFYQQMLELRGRPPGLIRSVLAPRGTHKSMVPHGQHEDDEEEEREKKRWLERWLEGLMSFEKLSAALTDRIAQNRDMLDERLDKINGELERLQTTDKQQQNLEKIAALKAHKVELKNTRKDLEDAERTRREAQNMNDLYKTQTTVQDVSHRVNAHVNSAPAHGRSWSSIFRKRPRPSKLTGASPHTGGNARQTTGGADKPQTKGHDNAPDAPPGYTPK